MPETVSLREHFEAILAEKDKALSAALASQEKAVAAALTSAALATSKAEEQAKDWRASANEWRAAMVDREARFVTLAAYEGAVEKLNEVTRRLERNEGKNSGIGLSWAILLAAVGAVGALGSLYAIFHH